MKAAIVLCLFAILGAVMAVDINDDGSAKLQYVKSVQTCYQGMCAQGLSFVVEVKNVAYDKSVVIRNKHPRTGVWSDLPLVYSAPGKMNGADHETDLFAGWMNFDLGSLGDVEYVVKYTVAGNTYYQHNLTTENNTPNKDYLMPGSYGVILLDGRKVFHADWAANFSVAAATTATTGSTYFYAYAKSKSDSGAAISKLVVHATFTAAGNGQWVDFECNNYYPYSYSSTPNPSPAGYEARQCDITIPVTASVVRYALYVKYTDGTQVWDNNYSRDYYTNVLWTRY